MQNLATKNNVENNSKRVFLENNIDNMQEILLDLYRHCSSGQYIKLMNRNKPDSGIFITKDTIKDKYKLQKVLEFQRFENLMISFNTFSSKGKATLSNLKAVSSFCIDVDYKRVSNLKDLTPRQIIGLLEMELFGHEIPYPTYIEFSNQVRLIYLLKNPIIKRQESKSLLSAVKRFTAVFIERLDAFGAEKQSLCSFVRFPYSVNTKNDSQVIFEKFGDFLELDELFEYMPDLPEWYSEWKSSEKPQKAHTELRKVKGIRSTIDVNKSRMDDLVTLQRYFNEYHNGGKGYRQTLCYLYRNFALQYFDDFQKAKEEMLIFNQGFTYPHRENNLVSKTNTRKIYLYKDETLRQMFGENLCDELGVFNGMSNAEKCRRYTERKKIERINNGETKAQQIEKAKHLIQELRKQGKKYKEVSEILDMPIDTVKRHIKSLKKEGRL